VLSAINREHRTPPPLIMAEQDFHDARCTMLANPTLRIFRVTSASVMFATTLCSWPICAFNAGPRIPPKEQERFVVSTRAAVSLVRPRSLEGRGRPLAALGQILFGGCRSSGYCSHCLAALRRVQP